MDAFITCCGEETDVILDTVRAACDVDYPANRFRVILLDDGGSAELSAQVTIMQGRYSNLYYTARKKAPGVPHHYKAGNLNHGLDYVKQLEGGPAEYIAALDADMIPEKPWLRTVVAHLVMDPELAMSCPPQVGSSAACERKNLQLRVVAVILQCSHQRSSPSEPECFSRHLGARQRFSRGGLVHRIRLRRPPLRH